MENKRLKALIECALLIALGTILAQIKIYRMPYGGSVTAFSMVPFIIISYRHGLKWGLLSGFANALLQMTLGGIYPPPANTVLSLVLSILLDYFLAYMVLGLAVLFAKPFKEKRIFGYVFGSFVVCFLRFVCAFISGWVIWGDMSGGSAAAMWYSLVYNGSYLLPETLITCLGIGLLSRYMIKLYDAN